MYAGICLMLLSLLVIGNTVLEACPLGSYCPLATLNKTTGVCEPWVIILNRFFSARYSWYAVYWTDLWIYSCRYLYQLPPMQPNHSCGGANIWADFSSSSETFCSAGSFCPTTTTKFPCSSGYYFVPTLDFHLNYQNWISDVNFLLFLLKTSL